MSDVFKVRPTVQKYGWGKYGSSSKVAQLASVNEDFVKDEDTPYAELWMGTHPTSPSHVGANDQLLSNYLAANPKLIGQPVISKFDAQDGNLPFLFKVLSIQKALSIQMHPDKVTAEKLHVERPDVYKDDNHKPEMAIALSPFTALCGFLPLSSIAQNLNSTPEFAALLPKDVLSAFLSLSSSPTPGGSVEKDALKALFAATMTASPEVVKSQLLSLVNRYESNRDAHPSATIVLLLNSQFPGDIGIFCVYLLNTLYLEPGEAIFLSAGEPHAYLSGDAIECMANSDNVVRAGLTPKLRDVPTLVDNLSYDSCDGQRHFVSPKTVGVGLTVFVPPVPEFSVMQAKIENVKTEVPVVDGPSIMVVVEGSGKLEAGKGRQRIDLTVGDVVFIPAATDISLDGTLLAYTAFTQM